MLQKPCLSVNIQSMKENRQKICNTDWECLTISLDTYISKAVFTHGARVVVPGHEHKMVLCSDTEYPISWSPVQCSNSGVGTWKKGVFTLAPFKNRHSFENVLKWHRSRHFEICFQFLRVEITPHLVCGCAQDDWLDRKLVTLHFLHPISALHLISRL